MDTLESLQRKIASAAELESVVKTMKAVAASNIGQYQMAMDALFDYYNTVELGIMAYFSKIKSHTSLKTPAMTKDKSVGAILFGSDQGLVGQFNEVLASFAGSELNKLTAKKQVWAVGSRIQNGLRDAGLVDEKLFSVPSSVGAITSFVGNILISIEAEQEKGELSEVYIYHNRLKVNGGGYAPFSFRLLPLDENWMQSLQKRKWPTNKLPQLVGGTKATLSALIKEYLFAAIYRACTESLASENASRLAAMQRAEKNIDELLQELQHKFHRLRQSSIDEELFDVVAGFEALKKRS